MNAESDADKTKLVERLDAAFMAKLAQESAEAESDTKIIEEAVKDIAGTSVMPESNPFVVAEPTPVPEQPAEGTK